MTDNGVVHSETQKMRDDVARKAYKAFNVVVDELNDVTRDVMNNLHLLLAKDDHKLFSQLDDEDIRAPFHELKDTASTFNRAKIQSVFLDIVKEKLDHELDKIYKFDGLQSINACGATIVKLIDSGERVSMLSEIDRKAVEYSRNNFAQTYNCERAYKNAINIVQGLQIAASSIIQELYMSIYAGEMAIITQALKHVPDIADDFIKEFNRNDLTVSEFEVLVQSYQVFAKEIKQIYERMKHLQQTIEVIDEAVVITAFRQYRCSFLAINEKLPDALIDVKASLLDAMARLHVVSTVEKPAHSNLN